MSRVEFIVSAEATLTLRRQLAAFSGSENPSMFSRSRNREHKLSNARVKILGDRAVDPVSF